MYKALEFGLFAYIISLLAFKSYSPNLELKINKNHQLIIFSLCLASISLIPRINSYKTFIEDPFKKPEISAEIIEYRNFKDHWVLPKNGDQCWINLDCIPYEKNVYKTKYFGFEGIVIKKN